MKKFALTFSILIGCVHFSNAQIDTNIINSFRTEESNHSMLEVLGLQLIDDIGPRLMGTPQFIQANNWLVKTYNSWGIDAHNEQYGTWKGWERGETDAVMTYPRFQQLSAIQLGWSPQTPKGQFIEGDVIALPNLEDSLSFIKWLPNAKGKIVLISQPQFSGRPESDWKEFALANDYQQYLDDKKKANDDWRTRMNKMKTNNKLVQTQLENAGALAIVSSTWPGSWSVSRIYGTKTKKIAHINLKLEDYMLLYRFTQRGIVPKIKIKASSKSILDLPAQNTVAEIKSTINPNQYVMLSAHLDSWDGATGATDNGTGTILMMEVMRILKKYYPNPKRNIIVGHWGGEEQGLNGSRAFAEDHKDMMPKISVLFNQDNGTGRINHINCLGFLDAYDYFDRWFSYLPKETKDEIKTDYPGNPGGRGASDYFSFLTYGVPAFFLISNSWDYGEYTWHSNIDTYDKIVWSDIKRNAVTIATLVYLACEEPEMFSRKHAQLPMNISTGERMTWPTPTNPARNSDEYLK